MNRRAQSPSDTALLAVFHHFDRISVCFLLSNRLSPPWCSCALHIRPQRPQTRCSLPAQLGKSPPPPPQPHPIFGIARTSPCFISYRINPHYHHFQQQQQKKKKNVSTPPLIHTTTFLPTTPNHHVTTALPGSDVSPHATIHTIACRCTTVANEPHRHHRTLLLATE
eukprot:CAMPEP_0171984742 /NCGR_PEP_ID=MMETSP0993-20121228/273987_1 /TAXON_ID=483369 /ORGANISM="non described non described, Strain CCMP2098" /LENGTH=166 /DNA_ID=CAMNT_0012637575 /DNA_START=532 /DNA_END=1033 /DNA_ORIENTATION=+